MLSISAKKPRLLGHCGSKADYRMTIKKQRRPISVKGNRCKHIQDGRLAGNSLRLRSKTRLRPGVRGGRSQGAASSGSRILKRGQIAQDARELSAH